MQNCGLLEIVAQSVKLEEKGGGGGRGVTSAWRVGKSQGTLASVCNIDIHVCGRAVSWDRDCDVMLCSSVYQLRNSNGYPFRVIAITLSHIIYNTVCVLVKGSHLWTINKHVPTYGITL